MAEAFGGLQSNMGPFKPVSLKGNAFVHGVPMFVDKLPMTIGGIAGDDIPFGRLVSINPQDRRKFVLGCPSGNVVKGVSMLDPAILTLDPGQKQGASNYYFVGRPMTATTLGVLDILEYDVTQKAPAEGISVYARKDNGMLAFADSNPGTDYIKLNAFVYETLDPNGAKVFFNVPLVEPGAEESLTATADPVFTPAAGAVAAGTQITITCETPDSVIFYTLDGTEPTMASSRYEGPIALTAAATFNAVAVAPGKNPSSVIAAAYTLA